MSDAPLPPPTDRPHVLVAGGGVAGLEALLALRDLAPARFALTLLEPEDEFVYRPSAVAEPFSRGHARRHPLRQIAADLGADVVRGRLAEVDPGAREVVTDTGARLGYDALLVAVGAGSAPALPNVTTWTPASDPDVFGGLLRDLEEGYTKRVAFVVPLRVAWPLPAYELALMTGWEARGMGQSDVQITVYTPEDRPLALFGPAAADALADDLAEVGVTVRTGVHVGPGDDGGLVTHPGGHALDAQRVVALPRAAAHRVPGLPEDPEGFIPVDRHGRVEGVDAVWAAGDAIAFPVKQGGLASQQADAAARSIAAALGANVDPQPFRPVLRGVVLTGRGRAWLRGEPAGGAGGGAAAHHALFWPPTKIAGRYLSPYLAERDESEAAGDDAHPDGRPVDLDLDREMPAAARALREDPGEARA